MTADVPQRPAAVDNIEAKTGLSWDDLLAVLEAAGGKDATHTELAAAIAKHLTGKVSNNGWWAQAATVAYEQQIGRRQPGQSCTGDFQVSITKTITADLDAALQRFAEIAASTGGQFDGVEYAKQPRTSASEKWRYWRVELADGAKVDVTISLKPPVEQGKSLVAVQVSKLGSGQDRERWRAYFKGLLAEL